MARATPTPTVLDPVAPGVPGNGRAWELVSPGEVVPGHVGENVGVEEVQLVPFPGAISRSGDRLAYAIAGALPVNQSEPTAAYVISRRGANGWSSDESIESPQPEYVFNFYGDQGPVAFSPELTASIWVNPVPTGENNSEHGVYASKPGGGYTLLGNAGNGNFLAASEDLRRVIFSSDRHLLPGDASRTEGTSLYESFDSALHLIDVDDGGSLISDCGSSATREAVSADALQVFFSSNPACGSHKRVYLREAGHTTEISASQCTVACGPEEDVFLFGHTTSGNAAFLASTQRLTNEDSNSGQDIYRYDVASGQLSLLFVPPASNGSEVVFPVRAAGDWSRVYFMAKGQLIPGLGSDEGLNLYLVDAGGLHFLAPIADGNFAVSPDGRYVLFPTATSLRPADIDGRVDLYRYDADGGDFAWVSGGAYGAGNGPVDVAMPRPSAAADLARRVVFTTAEPLLAQDRNGDADVYEWTPTGLSLISPGLPRLRAGYVEMTADGGTVVFWTAATLLPRDRDGGEIDYYAARVGGGFPEPVVENACEGANCGSGTKRSPRSLPDSGGGKLRLGLARIDAAGRRQLLAKGWTTVLAETPAAGKLLATGRARIGSRRQTVLTASARVEQPGPIRLRLQLTRIARRSLDDGERLRVRLALSQQGQGSTATTFVLGAGR